MQVYGGPYRQLPHEFQRRRKNGNRYCPAYRSSTRRLHELMLKMSFRITAVMAPVAGWSGSKKQDGPSQTTR